MLARFRLIDLRDYGRFLPHFLANQRLNSPISSTTRKMAEAAPSEEAIARFDELTVLEAEFDKAELEISK